MARQWAQMAAVMMQAAQKLGKVVSAPVRFVGRAVMQAAERLIPQGAAEIGQALFTGNAYAPPGLTEKHPEQDKGNVHGTGAAQAAPAPAPKPPAPAAAPTHAMTASTYLAPSGYGQRLDQQAARMPDKGTQQERGR